MHIRICERDESRRHLKNVDINVDDDISVDDRGGIRQSVLQGGSKIRIS